MRITQTHIVAALVEKYRVNGHAPQLYRHRFGPKCSTWSVRPWTPGSPPKPYGERWDSVEGWIWQGPKEQMLETLGLSEPTAASRIKYRWQVRWVGEKPVCYYHKSEALQHAQARAGGQLLDRITGEVVWAWDGSELI